jgi:coiled-coil domain-containing protein 130
MQGFNRYYPPDYNPKHAHKGNLNKLAGKKARSNVVRFEMPFNMWCGHCDKHIAQGVRFNAQKNKTGQYFTTSIWRFTIRCHECTGTIEIETNPKETSYNVISGGSRRNEEWDAQENGGISVEAPHDLDEDALTRLEAETIETQTRAQSHTHLTQLEAANRRQWSDPYASSQKLRKRFREGKKKQKQASYEREKIGRKYGLAIDMLGSNAQDQVAAKRIAFEASSSAKSDATGKQGAKEALAQSLLKASRNRDDPFQRPATRPCGAQQVGKLVEYASSDEAVEI